MNVSKGQAAMEFLITYGWAILVVVGTIAALSYFGYLEPEKFLPVSCTLGPGMTCVDFNVESMRVVLVLQNNLGEKITIDDVEIIGPSTCSNPVSIELDISKKALITVANCDNGEVGARFSADLIVTYTKLDKLSHSMEGKIIAKVGGEAAISGQEICQNAQDNGLCGGLDLVYGEGYQGACCSEFSLCC